MLQRKRRGEGVTTPLVTQSQGMVGVISWETGGCQSNLMGKGRLKSQLKDPYVEKYKSRKSQTEEKLARLKPESAK